MSRRRARTPAPTGRVTLKQIADEVDLPVMAVSRALHGKPGTISQERRERILMVAERLGYRPNLVVRAMQTGRSRTIGVCVSPQGDFGARMVCGIHQELATSGHLPLLHWRTEPDLGDADRIRQSELAVINALLDHRVDGVILFPADDWVLDLHFQELQRRQVPLVVVDRQLKHVTTDFVGTDDRLGARLAAEHLLARGHRHVAQLAGDGRYGTYADRRSAFEDTMRAAGGTCVTVDKPPLNELAETIRLTNHLLDAKPRPTAIFLAQDHLAAGVYAAAQARGLRMPQDLSVVGFADLTHAALMQPPLTTVRQDPEAIGRQAATILLRRLQGVADAQAAHVRLPPELIVRASTASPGQPGP
jgi:LacI family transcriptional regulator